MVTVVRYILFIPSALIAGIFIPSIILRVNFFIENILGEWEGDILFFLDGKIAFLYFISLMAGFFGGLGLIYTGLYVAPSENKLIVGCLVSLSILINCIEGYTQAISDFDLVLKGAALLVPVVSLTTTLFLGYMNIIKEENILKS